MMNTLYFSFFAYGVMGLMVLRAVAHRTVFHARMRRWAKIDIRNLEQDVEGLRSRPFQEWQKTLVDRWPVHPSTVTVLWATQQVHRLDHPDHCETHLIRAVYAPFEDLAAEARRNGNIATAAGLFFTIAGMMLFAILSAQTLTASLMIHTMGPALGTTAIGAVVSIMEKNLVDGAVARFQRRFHDDAEHLLHMVRDQFLARTWFQRRAQERNGTGRVGNVKAVAG